MATLIGDVASGCTRGRSWVGTVIGTDEDKRYLVVDVGGAWVTVPVEDVIRVHNQEG